MVIKIKIKIFLPYALGFNYWLFIGISNIAWKKVFCGCFGDLFGKGLLGSNSTLVYFIVGYGVSEVIDSHVDLEEFKSLGSFGGLGYHNALAIHNTHLLPGYSIHIV